MLEVVRFGDYSVVSKIGQGSYGKVYAVKDIHTNEDFAAKVESQNIRHTTLKFESAIMQALNHSKYVPRLMSMGKTPQFSYIVMELLGPSLITVLKRLKRKSFSLSTTLRVAFHLMKAIEEMHNNSIIHRDIKPANILLHTKGEVPIALIDYGLARVYVNTKTHQHLPPRDHPGFRGTAIFASINAHLNQELSRRDDIVSWYYVIAFLLKRNLPWADLSSTPDILECKRRTDTPNLLMPELPEIANQWRMISSLRYDQRPRYEAIYIEIEKAISRLGIKWSDPYDWSILKSKSPDGTDASDSY